MRYAITFWIIILFQQISSGQSDATYYFAKDGRECSKELANSYKKTKLVDFSSKTYAYEDYSIDETLISKGFYVNNDFNLKTGTYVEYYNNGNERVRGTYLSDVSTNIRSQKANHWYFRYENDSMKMERLYAWDTTTNSFKSFIVNFWDTAGIKKVIDGNGDYFYTEGMMFGANPSEKITFSGSIKNGLQDGIWKGFYSYGSLYCEEIFNEKGLVKGKSYDRIGVSFTYTQIEAMPEYKGGDAALIRFMQNNIEYPWKERNNGIQGKVLITFVVVENGEVKDPVVTHSVSTGLDAEALRVVNKLPDFKPGALRGQPVRVKYTLPVSFRLN